MSIPKIDYKYLTGAQLEGGGEISPALLQNF